MPLLDQLLALPPGEAIFDMDGTLLHGDIGEAVLRRRLHALPPLVARVLGTVDPWRVYEDLVVADFCRAGDLAAQALAGLTVAEVDHLVQQCLEAGDVHPHVSVVALARELQLRHRVWIVTGSAEIIGRAVARTLGIHHVVGLRLREVEGRLTDELLPPCTCGQGKVEAARQFISPNPVFSIGDSPTDLPLLRLATVARTLGRIAGREFPAFVEEE